MLLKRASSEREKRGKNGLLYSNTKSFSELIKLRKKKIKEDWLNRSASLWLLFLAGCCILWLFAQHGGSAYTFHDFQEVPYEKTQSVWKTGADWVFDQTREAALKYPIVHGKDGYYLAGSKPHATLATPAFQEQMYKLTATNWKEYQRTLTDFANVSFRKKMAIWTNSAIKRIGMRGFSPQEIPLQIWQTGKHFSDTANSFQEMNPHASYNFYDDKLLEEWMSKHFRGTVIQRVWDSMERVVLKADLWRYLVMFVEGGFYSDVDTDCLKDVSRWGSIDAVTWDVGDKVTDKVKQSPPQVVVGIEVDVPDLTGWETFWPRPIQIVQWTMAGSPGHPIYLDAIRRVVNAMQHVQAWEKNRNEKANELLRKYVLDLGTRTERKQSFSNTEMWAEVESLLTTDPFDLEAGGTMSLIEATGPGAFSDAVFSYLRAQYGIHWSQLHNIQTTTRIGDVAIVPITGFAPFYKPNWQRWRGIDKGPMAVVGDVSHSQALVNHHFSGSWRTEGDNTV